MRGRSGMLLTGHCVIDACDREDRTWRRRRGGALRRRVGLRDRGLRGLGRATRRRRRLHPRRPIGAVRRTDRGPCRQRSSDCPCRLLRELLARLGRYRWWACGADHRAAGARPAGRPRADGRRHQRRVPIAVPLLRSRPVRQRDGLRPRAGRGQRQDPPDGGRSGPTKTVRSIQLYGVDPTTIGRAVRILVTEIGVDHIDLNMGCPVPKVTRLGGGAALPLHGVLFAGIVGCGRQGRRRRSRSRSRCGWGSTPATLTYLEAGRTAADEGAAAVALHARTAEQLYSGTRALGRDQRAQASRHRCAGAGQRRHLGRATDGRRDARGRPAATGLWSVAAASADPGCSATSPTPSRVGRSQPPPRLGTVVDVMRRHARLLVEVKGDELRRRPRLPQARRLVPDRLPGRGRGPA